MEELLICPACERTNAWILGGSGMRCVCGFWVAQSIFYDFIMSGFNFYNTNSRMKTQWHNEKVKNSKRGQE